MTDDSDGPDYDRADAVEQHQQALDDARADLAAALKTREDMTTERDYWKREATEARRAGEWEKRRTDDAVARNGVKELQARAEHAEAKVRELEALWVKSEHERAAIQRDCYEAHDRGEHAEAALEEARTFHSHTRKDWEDEKSARARAEAACAQMRAALEAFKPFIRSDRWDHLGAPALATDVGAGYVSPERHAEVVAAMAGNNAKVIAHCESRLAEVVRERDAAREDVLALREEAGRAHDRANTRGVELVVACARLAEVTAQAALLVHFAALTRPILGWLALESTGLPRVRAREALAALDTHDATGAGRALAERVRLLEAVVKAARILAADSWRKAVVAVDDALAALDAHDKAGGRSDGLEPPIVLDSASVGDIGESMKNAALEAADRLAEMCDTVDETGTEFWDALAAYRKARGLPVGHETAQAAPGPAKEVPCGHEPGGAIDGVLMRCSLPRDHHGNHKGAAAGTMFEWRRRW